MHPKLTFLLCPVILNFYLFYCRSGIDGNGHCDPVDNQSMNSWVDIPHPACDTVSEQSDMTGVKSEIPGSQAAVTGRGHDIRVTKSDGTDIKSRIDGNKSDITETVCKADIAGNVRMDIGDILVDKSETKQHTTHVEDGHHFDATDVNKTVLPAIDISNVSSVQGLISEDVMVTNGQVRKSESPNSTMLDSAMSCSASDTRMTTSDSGMDSDVPTPSEVWAQFRIPDSNDRCKAWDVSFSDIHADSGASTDIKQEDQKAWSSFDNESESSGQTLTDSQGELQLNGVCATEMNRPRKSTDSGIEGESKVELSPDVQEMERTCAALQVDDQLTCDEGQTLTTWPGSGVEGSKSFLLKS